MVDLSYKITVHFETATLTTWMSLFFQLFALHSLLIGGRDLTFPLYKDKRNVKFLFLFCVMYGFSGGR